MPSGSRGPWICDCGGSPEDEALFREINERRRASAAEVWAHQHGYPFLCECADPDCDKRLALSESEYEHVRSQGRWFLVAPGHVSPEIEEVVDAHCQFEVVEMTGEAGQLAERWDSRTRSSDAQVS